MNKCLQCGKDTSNPKFCSKSCSAIFNNLKAGRKQPLGECLNCGIKIGVNGYRSSSRKFCSNKCGAEYQAKIYVEKWLKGETTGGTKRDPQCLSQYIRNYLLKNSDYKCSKCGWGETNEHSGNIPLEIDHIDGHSENNRPENLRVLCPNCHSLTAFNGILNKGKGRRRYRELYIKK